MLRHFHPQRKGAYTVWGRQNEERKRNLGYRVDYILLAEPPETPGAAHGSRSAEEMLEKVRRKMPAASHLTYIITTLIYKL